MGIRGRKINVFSLLGGLLFLASLPLMWKPSDDVFAYVLAMIMIIMGLSILLISILGKKRLNIITLVVGLVISAIGTYGIYDVLTGPGGNSVTDSIAAFMIGTSGYLCVTGALIALFGKQPVRLEFDSI
jgi:uncharacterized membrane protein